MTAGNSKGARGASRLVVVTPLLLETWATRRGLAFLRETGGVEVVRCGMGAGAARRTAERLRRHPARCLAVAGLAGAVDPAVRPGDVVIAGRLHGPGSRSIELEPVALASAVEALGLRVHTVDVACVDHLVRGAERESLRARGVAAVDMESFWLAEACAGRPFACLRVIVDGPGHEVVSPSIISRGAHALATLSRAVAALPQWAVESTVRASSHAAA
jgi:4-hydroxy-3-methylbut-2-enyl diphosphate reductase